jgi:hypothetical protein
VLVAYASGRGSPKGSPSGSEPGSPRVAAKWVCNALVHLAVWLPSPGQDAPFDPRRYWLLGDTAAAARTLALAACLPLAGSGVLVLAGAQAGAALAVVGAVVSLTLVLLTFHPWLLGAVAIDVAIVVLALT